MTRAPAAAPPGKIRLAGGHGPAVASAAMPDWGQQGPGRDSEHPARRARCDTVVAAQAVLAWVDATNTAVRESDGGPERQGPGPSLYRPLDSVIARPE